MSQLDGEDFASADIIPISKAPRNDEDLEAVQQSLVFPKSVDMNAFGAAAGLLPAEAPSARPTSAVSIRVI